MGISITARLAVAITLLAVVLLFKPELWISLILTTLGLILLTLAFVAILRRPQRESGNLTLFQPGLLGHVPQPRKVRPINWFIFLSRLGFLYSQMLILLVIPGILVFHYAWGHGRHYYGLFVLTNISPSMRPKSCGESWVVRIDAKESWYLNSMRTSPSELPRLLRQGLGPQTDCVVYLDVDRELPYSAAIQAIDVVNGTQAKAVVLLTHGLRATSKP